jgi:hypothetical protein
MKNGERIGVLSYCSSEVGEFDAEMIDLLERVGANASFALDRFEREAERLRAEPRPIARTACTRAERDQRGDHACALARRAVPAGLRRGGRRRQVLLAAVLLPDRRGRGSGRRDRRRAGRRRAAARARISGDASLPEGQGAVGIAFAAASHGLATTS